jgi:ribosomal-protein-alanine N-acetyltransferase
VAPTSVALVTDYLMNQVGLHRVEIDIRPENTASLRVIEKLGFRYEGIKQRYIHINGDWRDHYIFALTAEEIPEGILNRFLRKQVPPQKYPWN